MTVQNQTAASKRVADNSTTEAYLIKSLIKDAPSRGLEPKCDALSKAERDSFMQWVIEYLEARVAGKPMPKGGAASKALAEIKAAFLRFDDDNQRSLFHHACHVDANRLVARYNDLRLRDAVARRKQFDGRVPITDNSVPIPKRDVLGRAFAAYTQWCSRRGVPNEATECAWNLRERIITLWSRSDASARPLAKYKIGRGYSIRRVAYKPSPPVMLTEASGRGLEFFYQKWLTRAERSKLKAQMHVGYGAPKSWPAHLRFIAKAA